MALHHLSNSCCWPLSLSAWFFICKIGVPGPCFLSPLFLPVAARCRAAPQASFLPLCLASRFALHQLQQLLEVLWHCIAHLLPSLPMLCT